MKKPEKSTSSSTIFYVPENNRENDTILMLSLLAREYTLGLSSPFKCQLYVGYKLIIHYSYFLCGVLY